jgi:hypothetical protein
MSSQVGGFATQRPITLGAAPSPMNPQEATISTLPVSGLELHTGGQSDNLSLCLSVSHPSVAHDQISLIVTLVC